MTPFLKKCELLSELWFKHREDYDFADFISYNDLSLPLAHAIHRQIVETTPKAEEIINQAWAMLLEDLELSDGVPFDSLEELLAE